jgi:hypothetical protein
MNGGLPATISNRFRNSLAPCGGLLSPFGAHRRGVRVCRGVVVAALVLAGLGIANGQDVQPLPSRYGVFLDARLYPQSTPTATLTSILGALDRGRIDYVLAHLTEPAFVDDRVARVYRGDFDALVGEATLKLADEPSVIQLLRRFTREGDWQENDAMASARLKDIPDRQVRLRKIGPRWYLENRQK